MDGAQRLDLFAACLREGAQDAELRALLAREHDWPEFARRASEQMVSTAIASELLRRSLLDSLPDDFAAYLRGMLELNVERNEKIAQQLAEAVRTLNAAGIEPVLLKGSAALESGLYRHPGSRLISDLDLLVPAETLRAGSDALQTLGYRRITDAKNNDAHYAEMHHDAPMIHPERVASVELHRRPLHSVRATRIMDAIRSSEVPTNVAGARALLPDVTSMLAHNFLHQMVQDSAHVRGLFQLRQLYEAALLVHRDREQIQWRILLDAIASGGCREEWGSFVALLENQFQLRLPYGTSSRLRSRVWLAGARAQYRWPAVRRFNQRVFQRLRRVVPPSLRARLGWEDYGWPP